MTLPFSFVDSAILSSLAGAVVGSVITWLATRDSLRKNRIDEYRREVRSAAAAVMSAVGVFSDTVIMFRSSIFWVDDTVQCSPHCGKILRDNTAAHSDLDEKIARFDLLAHTDPLSLMVSIPVSITANAMNEIVKGLMRSNYSKAELEKDRETLLDRCCFLRYATSQFREHVKNRFPPTIVVEERRREHILGLLKVSRHWLTKRRKTKATAKPDQQDS